MDKFIYKYKNAPITTILIGICVSVYIISVFLFGIEMDAKQGLAFGAYNPLYVVFNHEYYRFITANFIHFGLLHLVVNCYSMYGIGMFIERTLKIKKYIIVIIVSALTTTGLPFILFLINGFEMYTISGGISGVIFGLIGSLGALALKYKNIFMDIFKQLTPNLILMLGISFIIPSISLSGHVSGFIGGFISTYIILLLPRKNKYQELLN